MNKIETPDWVPHGGMTSVSWACYYGYHKDSKGGCGKDQDTCICPCHDPDAIPVEETR